MKLKGSITFYIEFNVDKDAYPDSTVETILKTEIENIEDDPIGYTDVSRNQNEKINYNINLYSDQGELIKEIKND